MRPAARRAPRDRDRRARACASYAVSTTFMQYVITARWEGEYVFVGHSKTDGAIGVCSRLPRYDDVYHISLGRPTPARADHVSADWSVTRFFDVNGVFCRQKFYDELKHLLADWSKNDAAAGKKKSN